MRTLPPLSSHPCNSHAELEEVSQCATARLCMGARVPRQSRHLPFWLDVSVPGNKVFSRPPPKSVYALHELSASEGHSVEYNAMNLVVGFRRSPGATILGVRVLVPHLPITAYVLPPGLVLSRRCGVPATDCCGTSPTGCRDLLHSALVSGRLCQVRAARHCSFPNSVLEQLHRRSTVTGDQEAEGR